jgi:hypothetical protein
MEPNHNSVDWGVFELSSGLQLLKYKRKPEKMESKTICGRFFLFVIVKENLAFSQKKGGQKILPVTISSSE